MMDAHGGEASRVALRRLLCPRGGVGNGSAIDSNSVSDSGHQQTVSQSQDGYLLLHSTGSFHARNNYCIDSIISVDVVVQCDFETGE